MSSNQIAQPEHQVHSSSDALPPQPPVDCSTMEPTPSSTSDSMNVDSPGDTAFNADRPLDAPEGNGVAVNGTSDLPIGKASLGDKVIGKAQKVAGKFIDDPDLHEKGQLREAGGKDAVLGYARVPHA